MIREIPLEARPAAAGLARSWGFPRLITWAEVHDGIWITDHPQTGVAWMTRGIEENHWMLHAMPSPHTGLRLPCDETMRSIRVTACLIGATRLYAPLGPDRPGWQRWLMQSGWFEQRDVVGPYMDLET